MTDPTQVVVAGTRKYAATIAAGVAGVSTLALLAAGSLMPLISALASGSLTAPVIAAWLGGLGGNVLADWLDEWARSRSAGVLQLSPEDDSAAFVALAQELHPLIGTDSALMNAVTALIERSDAITITLTTLQGQAEAQTRILRQLLDETQQVSLQNKGLHDLIFRTITHQGTVLLTAISASEQRLHGELASILEAVQAIPTSRKKVHHMQERLSMSPNQVETQSSALRVSWPLSIPNEPYYLLPGREQELIGLLEVLQEPHGPSIITIDGLGGLGKTALAVELARRALAGNIVACVVGDSAKSEIFVGGEIVQLPEAHLDFDRLLDTIARQLNRWDIPTMRPEEKYFSVANVLQQQRCLVLVDNLETAAGTQELATRLQGLLGDSRSIITSRKQVKIDTARPLSLHQLGREDALLFLHADAAQRQVQQILTATEARLIDIHRITGGAPLAMKLVVSQARYLDIDHILRNLAQAEHQLYFYIYRQSWEQLSLAAKKILIYLGRTVVTTVHLDELGYSALARDESELLTAIEQLVAYSLVEVSFAGGKTVYGLHQLTRNFVNGDLPKLWHMQGSQ